MDKKTTYDRIVETADQLFYEQGFEHTSFADIASAVGISRGNFYHHFKSKDDILDAVITLRLKDRQDMLEQWQLEGNTPEERIRSFIYILITNQAKIMLYGCPIGTLSTELAKLNHPSQGGASELFTVFRTWLRRQFVQMGHEDIADDLAMHLLARSQGVATLANAFHDEDFVKREVDEMCAWASSYAQQKAKENVHHNA